jgi:hypothetical protein
VSGGPRRDRLLPAPRESEQHDGAKADEQQRARNRDGFFMGSDERHHERTD